MKKITYVYRQRIERGDRWQDGFSRDKDGFPVYPLMTRRECQADAKRQGAVAQFLRSTEAARSVEVNLGVK